MALILPKGIVVNSPHVQGDIERIDAEPLDEADIAKVWKVYTTTQRRLLDPTAERLENLWWRIWGSPKKSLKGATVARLFAQISHGQTFVPLRGPPNRHEGSPPLTTNSRQGPAASSTSNIRYPAHSRPSTTSSSVASRAPGSMPHPILKKTRGPSSTGPRPTARFISPHESQDEADRASSVSPNTHVTVQPPSPSQESQEPKTDKKSAAVQTKKTFLASTKKKRPVIVRRQSSQTSQSSADIAAASAGRASESGQSSSAIQSSSERTPPTFTQQARGQAQSKFQENFSSSLQRSGGSTQSTKKQTSRSTDIKRAPQRGKGTEVHTETDLAGDPGPSKQLQRIENLQEHVDELSAEELEELELQRMLLEQANARVRKQSQTTQATQTPSLSESAHEGLRIVHNSLRSRPSASHGTEGPSAMGLLQHDAKGATSAAPTLTDASGHVNLGSVGHQQGRSLDSNVSRTAGKGKGRDPDEVQRNSMFAKRPVQPVQLPSSPDTSGPLSRSKSQLTLLLEKDRERGGGKKPDKEQSQGKKK
ncbi:uncharacterized protein LY89DRAFT_278679 [Mollisia scopiformis]|uniref:Nitrogen regulatory protein areA GATA-like domain-containing protein n=1 Tax=Mollisia scopiformis TaxID=149040 RepID=A0A132BDD5_MOLSC|nr:uncharacterized protein LY89DRAFT_278679 [Mollisia scopiformis]KUJ09854.1 hypothetical protein LY89DRAFT_278679 [Mollisia scopiformis]